MIFQPQPNTRLLGWRLGLARLAWGIIVLLCLIILAIVAPQFYRITERDWQVVVSYQAVYGFVAHSDYVLYILTMRYLVLGVYMASALIIVLRKSDDRMGLFASATLVLMPIAFLFLGETETLLFRQPWDRVVENIRRFIGVATVACMVMFFYLFPDGRFAPRWMSRVIIPATVFLALLFNLIDLPGMDLIGDFYWWILVSSLVVVLLGSISSQVYRYRYLAGPVYRQQIKWVVFAFSSFAAGFVVMVLIGEVPDDSPILSQVNFFSIHLNLLILAFIPVSIGISILRYQLWDIDVIIRRTLVYTSLTAMLGLLYFGMVILLQGVTRALVGGSGQVATVISTLVIAALFTPLRRRVQDAIDRRFYRQKYDAQQALASFAETARNETDLEALTAQMLGIVQATMRPEQVSLWLRQEDQEQRGENRLPSSASRSIL